LDKESTLDEEYQYMQQHAKIGGDALTYLHDIVGEQSFLTIAKEIAYYHHEKWNGKGYPFYLKQEQIPLSARIVSLCDVYDALTTKRPYKAAYSHERSCEIIYDLAGTQFDPIIISIFSSIESEFKAIRKKFAE
jgi:putative two-component system response regulator